MIHIEQDGSGWKGTLSCAPLNAELELEAEEVSAAYVRRCAEAAEQMPEKVRLAVLEAAKRYCLRFIETEKEAVGEAFAVTEEYHKVTAETPAQAMLPLFSFLRLLVNEVPDENRLFFRLTGSCSWEPEHGIEAAFTDDGLVYLGDFESISPDGLEYWLEEEGRERNYALQP